MLAHTQFTLHYEPLAVVRHYHRATLTALLQQRFRHGVGRALLDRKYGAAEARATPAPRTPFWQRPHRRGLLRRDALLEILGVAAFHLGRLAAASRPPR
jgi:hypothetical protein